MINGCAFCVDMHSADALKASESAARAEFDDEEVTSLVAAIGMINFWNRMAITFQTTPMSARRGQ